MHRREHAIHERTLRVLAAGLRQGAGRGGIACGLARGRGQCRAGAIAVLAIHFQPVVRLECAQGMFGLRPELARGRLQRPAIGAAVAQLVELPLQFAHCGTRCAVAQHLGRGRA